MSFVSQLFRKNYSQVQKQSFTDILQNRNTLFYRTPFFKNNFFYKRPPVAAFDRLRVVAASIDINRLSLPIQIV